MRQRKQGEKQDITEELDAYRSEKRSLSEQKERREAQHRRLERIETELEESKRRRESLQQRRTELEETVAELEAELEQLQSSEFEQIVQLHRDANELEYELGRLENDRQDVDSEIERIERKLEAASEYATRREEINERLSELRTYVERLEKDAIESFNEHMADVLDILDYDNIERIWIERLQRETRDGRQKSIESFFELHVVRSQPSGVTYEDTIDHLSESEREVTGLVFALAGYLVHDVYEEVPFMLLDSLEAIDSDRIARLVEYFSDYPGYLVVALLTEDAEALPGEYTRIEQI
jgi:DNA repair exonuclease SbcCD ATPase subunit